MSDIRSQYVREIISLGTGAYETSEEKSATKSPFSSRSTVRDATMHSNH